MCIYFHSHPGCPCSFSLKLTHIVTSTSSAGAASQMLGEPDAFPKRGRCGSGGRAHGTQAHAPGRPATQPRKMEEYPDEPLQNEPKPDTGLVDTPGLQPRRIFFSKSTVEPCIFKCTGCTAEYGHDVFGLRSYVRTQAPANPECLRWQTARRWAKI